MDVVIVVRRQNVITLFQRQAVIDQREPGRGVLRERDVIGIAADVLRDARADSERHVVFRALEESALDGEKGIRIELSPIRLDRFPHRPRMGGQIEEA